jgi:hypothetical protein
VRKRSLVQNAAARNVTETNLHDWAVTRRDRVEHFVHLATESCVRLTRVQCRIATDFVGSRGRGPWLLTNREQPIQI